jgi:hypothetical protein
MMFYPGFSSVAYYNHRRHIVGNVFSKRKKYNFSPPQLIGTSCWVDRKCALDLIRGGVAIKSHEPRSAKRMFNAAEKVLKKT